MWYLKATASEIGRNFRNLIFRERRSCLNEPLERCAKEVTTSLMTRTDSGVAPIAASL